MKIIFIAISLLISGCSVRTLPDGLEESKQITQRYDKKYVDVFKVVSKKMTSCYRSLGIFGNGYDVISHIDSDAKEGVVEVYHVGLTGAGSPEDSMMSRTVTIKDDRGATLVTTRGTTPMVVYMNHLAIKGWMNGNENCQIVE